MTQRTSGRHLLLSHLVHSTKWDQMANPDRQFASQSGRTACREYIRPQTCTGLATQDCAVSRESRKGIVDSLNDQQRDRCKCGELRSFSSGTVFAGEQLAGCGTFRWLLLLLKNCKAAANLTHCQIPQVSAVFKGFLRAIALIPENAAIAAEAMSGVFTQFPGRCDSVSSEPDSSRTSVASMCSSGPGTLIN